MSYGMGAALQAAVFQHLEQDATVTGLVGTSIFDAAPLGNVPGTYVVLGPEEVTDRSDGSHSGAMHEFTVSVVSDTAGFQLAKTVASAVSDSLVDTDLTLTRGRLVSLNFVKAKAERSTTGAQRSVDLRFRALLEDS